MKLSPGRVRSFRAKVLRHYENTGRSFAWRLTRNPYQIVVSEIMLQQTQTGRVAERYGRFLKKFPDFTALAKASPRAVLLEWQGLGYNRRALQLRALAKEVIARYGGRLPREETQLRALPGIGPYTAGALRAFVFNEPAVFIETNIRTVFLHEFFPRARKVNDEKLRALIERTCDRSNPRDWYYALMDYGVMLKKSRRNINKRSAHYVRQSRFEGSVRQVRGIILKRLLEERGMQEKALMESIGVRTEKFCAALEGLIAEKVVQRRGGRLCV